MSLEKIERLIPHRSLMKTIDELISFEAGGGEVKLIVDPQKPYFENAKFESLFSIELMAQSVAAVYGYSVRSQKKPRIGYLISIDSYEMLSFEEVNAGDELRIKVKLELNAEPIGVYQVECSHRGRPFSKAQMKVFLTDRKII